MPADSPRHGRLDNGLVAAEYAAVGDIDPRLGEYLLDVLGVGGIAAYLQPTSDLHPVTRAMVLPHRPTDRLFVDRDHLETARDYYTQITEAERADEDARTDPAADSATEDPDDPGPGQDRISMLKKPQNPLLEPETPQPERSEIDERFASIIAGLNLPSFPTWAANTKPPDTETTNPRHPLRRRGDHPTEIPGVPPDTQEEPSLLDGLDSFGADLPEDEDEEGYVPPPPPPFPQLSPAATVAMVSIAVGLALFFWPALLPLSINLTLLLGFGGILGGFVTLVLRLKPDHDEDSDGPGYPGDLTG